MPEKDGPHLVVPARAGRRPARGRRAQAAQVEVVDPGAPQVGGERGLGEPRTARAGHRPHVDQQFDAGVGDRLEEAGDRRTLVADGSDGVYCKALH